MSACKYCGITNGEMYMSHPPKCVDHNACRGRLTKKVETLRAALEFISQMGDDPCVNETISADTATEALEATKSEGDDK